jgi:hypothetical protein
MKILYLQPFDNTGIRRETTPFSQNHEKKGGEWRSLLPVMGNERGCDSLLPELEEGLRMRAYSGGGL